jgi:hypothetical protein
MKTIIQIFAIAIFLSACTSTQAQTATYSTNTSTSIPKELLPQFTVTPQITKTLQPTKTPAPSATATLKQEKIIAITGTHEAQQAAEATITAFGSICESPASDYSAQISPDSRWIAMVCKGKDGEIDSHLKVVNMRGNEEWTIHYADYAKDTYYDRWNMIRPFYWSTDGKYLYATSATKGSGCCWIGWDVLLVRLNLEDGQQAEIANYIFTDTTAANFSISSNERYVLSAPQDASNTLDILDLYTWKHKTIKLEFDNTEAGYTLMSDNNKKIILVLREYPEVYQGDLTFGSIVIINLEDGTQNKLLSGIEYGNMPIPVSWKDDNHVLLCNRMCYEKDYSLLDINTVELTEVENP